MNIESEKVYLREAVSLSEEYLNIPAGDTKPRTLEPTLERVANHRLATLEGFGKNSGFDIRQGKMQEAGVALLEEEFSGQQGIHIEYELSFFGINSGLCERFRPVGLERLSTSTTRHEPIRHVDWAADCSPLLTWDCDPAGDMAEREDPRWRYSVGKYLETTDLNDIIWYTPEHYTDLTEELSDFLDGRSRVLEVGFLHQRIQSIVHQINPAIEYHGVDIGIPAILQARERGITAFNSNAWYSIPYPDNFFDGIVATTIQAGGLFPNEEWLRVLKNDNGIFNASLQ